jgi:hypothetical protein
MSRTLAVTVGGAIALAAVVSHFFETPQEATRASARLAAATMRSAVDQCEAPSARRPAQRCAEQLEHGLCVAAAFELGGSRLLAELDVAARPGLGDNLRRGAERDYVACMDALR